MARAKALRAFRSEMPARHEHRQRPLIGIAQELPRQRGGGGLVLKVDIQAQAHTFIRTERTLATGVDILDRALEEGLE